MSRRYASRRYAGGLGPSRVRTRIPTTRQLGQWVSLRKNLRFRVRLQLFQSRCLSLLLAMSGRVFLFFPPRGHEPPSTLRDRLNPNLSLQRHSFPIPRYAKRPDVALYTVGPLFLLPTPSSSHCALKVSEHGSLCLATARRSFGGASSPTKVFSGATLSQCSRTRLSQGHGCTRSSDGLVSCAALRWCEARPGGVRSEVWSTEKRERKEKVWQRTPLLPNTLAAGTVRSGDKTPKFKRAPRNASAYMPRRYRLDAYAYIAPRCKWSGVEITEIAFLILLLSVHMVAIYYVPARFFEMTRKIASFCVPFRPPESHPCRKYEGI